MGKNYSKDIVLLGDIIDLANEINCAFIRFNIQTRKDLLNDKFVMDGCAFYISQMGEKAKNLTEDTLNYISQETQNLFVNLISLSKMRDRINHVYDTMNKENLCKVAFRVINPTFTQILANRISYCMQNKKS